jgi:CspA family cold shock protein
MNGELVRIFVDRGFGYIKGEDGVDYFVHRSAFLGDAVFETARPGLRVTFEAIRSPKGPRAENVRVR